MTTSRIGLSVIEAGWVLGKTESQIRRLVGRGVLTYAVAPRWIEPDGVRALLADGDELGDEALDAVLSGRIVVPRPVRRYGPPQPIFPFVLALLLEDAVLVGHSCGGRCGACPDVGASFTEVYDSPWSVCANVVFVIEANSVRYNVEYQNSLRYSR